MLGLNLLRLLVQNRIAEFHTELELISPEVGSSGTGRMCAAGSMQSCTAGSMCRREHVLRGACSHALQEACAAGSM
jgi:hypothetical protein